MSGCHHLAKSLLAMLLGESFKQMSYAALEQLNLDVIQCERKFIVYCILLPKLMEFFYRICCQWTCRRIWRRSSSHVFFWSSPITWPLYVRGLVNFLPWLWIWKVKISQGPSSSSHHYCGKVCECWRSFVRIIYLQCVF